MSTIGKISSFRQLAAAVGKAESTVHRWSRRPSWPWGSPPRWPIDLAAVLAWAASAIDQQADLETNARDPLRRARVAKLRLEADRLRLQVAILRGELIERSIIRADVAALVHGWRSALLGEARSTAAALDAAGLLTGPRKNAAALLLERFEALCHRFARGEGAALRRKGRHNGP